MFIGTILLTLTVFTVTIVLVSLKLKEEIHHQIVNRDAEILYLVTQINQKPGKDTSRQITDSTWILEQNLLSSLLRSSELQGVIAMQIFDANGKIRVSLPGNLVPASLHAEDLTTLKRYHPISRFHQKIWLESMFTDPQFILQDYPVPMVEVIVPIHADNVLYGITQVWIDGKSMQHELKTLNRNIVIQAGIALICGYLIIITILVWAFSRLQKSHRMLKDRTLHLQEANRELALAAKTSAIGSISAHLVHGLKSPLAGLKEFVSDQLSQLPDDTADEEWQTAKKTTLKMFNLIQEIVQVIQEENEVETYKLTLLEIISVVICKSNVKAEQKGVTLSHQSLPDYSFSNRASNLIILILDNLVRNAVEATQNGKKVELRSEIEANNLLIHVVDQGGGLPEKIKENPFKPCITSKPQGNGIGLAISMQLSRNIGARLKLTKTDTTGTCFTLKIPLEKE